MGLAGGVGCLRPSHVASFKFFVKRIAIGIMKIEWSTNTIWIWPMCVFVSVCAEYALSIRSASFSGQ